MIYIKGLCIVHYPFSRLFDYHKLKDGFRLDLLWITFTYPVSEKVMQGFMSINKFVEYGDTNGNVR